MKRKDNQGIQETMISKDKLELRMKTEQQIEGVMALIYSYQYISVCAKIFGFRWTFGVFRQTFNSSFPWQ